MAVVVSPTQFATEVAGPPITVSCVKQSSLGGRSGQVVFKTITFTNGETEVDALQHISFSLCAAWRSMLAHPERLTSTRFRLDAGSAFLALVHESLHIRLNEPDEGVVECAAYRELPSAVRLLPLPIATQRIIVHYAKAQHFAITDPAYRRVC